MEVKIADIGHTPGTLFSIDSDHAAARSKVDKAMAFVKQRQSETMQTVARIIRG